MDSSKKTVIKDVGNIEIRGNRVNNLKGIDVSIPRGKLTVITGVSGSGKSSLAFDTLYAEGQRRYVESLSSYSRQFLERMPKPDCDLIRYIPPAVALKQRVISRNPRSLVATSTELYHYLKILFARFGRTISPVSGKEVKKHTAHDVVSFSLSLPEGTRFLLLAPISLGANPLEQLKGYQSSGFSRVWHSGVVYRIDELGDPTWNPESLYLVIDRMTVKSREESYKTRLADSVEIAFYEGNGECCISVDSPTEKTLSLHQFSNRFEADGRTFLEPSLEMLDFNSPIGACPQCEGAGKIIGIAPEKIIPNENLSVHDGAVACWNLTKDIRWLWCAVFLIRATAYGFPRHTPYNQLTDAEKKMLWNGIPNPEDGKPPVKGINDFFQMLEAEKHKAQNRARLAHFRGLTVCPSCLGTRLKEDAQYLFFCGKNINDVLRMSITEARQFFDTLTIPEEIEEATKRVLFEIRSRLAVLCDVGVGYLALDRLSTSLSGGESQRIALATRLGSNLYGAMYVLDEPSIGLHERDTERLIAVVKKLRDAGNTLIVVEHDENMMRAADNLIDIGPDAGAFGGTVVFHGSPSSITSETPGYTAAYLSKRAVIPVPQQRRRWHKYIRIENAAKNNLKNISVKIPLEAMTVVTGVSGSGKSTLVRDFLYQGLLRYLDLGKPHILSGDLKCIKGVEYVDQNSVSRNARSNPVTYIGAYELIRTLYSTLPLAQQMLYSPSFFSFNSEHGRCPECKGDGVITVEMQFMADITLTCEVCNGKRFKREILEVEYHGKNISDLLQMSIDEAVEFFTQHPTKPITQQIVESLSVLQEVGLGYVTLGQSSSTLSGGEIQRLKLAYYFSQASIQPTLFIFDEPTTGLHFQDISLLMKAFDRLINMGHTVVIIEHNLEVIKCADYILDLGPEGGVDGGNLVAEGTPEEVAAVENSYTGQYLKEKLKE